MGMLDALLAGAGYYNQIQNLGNMQNTVGSTIANLQSTLPQYSQFRPYTITSGLANVTADDTGGYSLGLSGQQQALANQMFAGGQNLYQQALGDTSAREQDIYSRIRAMQTPMEQEQRLATENRMAAQGRLGLSSNQYGGSTPELMAQERAINEAKNAASLSAIQQAQAEQLQQANIGQQMLQAGYAPYTAAMGLMTPALQGSQIATQAGGTTADILGQLGLGGLTAQANLEKIRSELMGQGLGLLSSQLSGSGLDNWLTNLLGGAASGIGNALSGLFGGSSGGGYGGVDFLGTNYGAYTPFGTPNLGYSMGGGYDPNSSAGNNVMDYINNLLSSGQGFSNYSSYDPNSSAGANVLNYLNNYSGLDPLGYDGSGINPNGMYSGGTDYLGVNKYLTYPSEDTVGYGSSGNMGNI